MQYKIMYQPSYSLLELQLDPSESVVAESDDGQHDAECQHGDRGQRRSLWH